MTAAEVLIYLAACVVNGTPPDPAAAASVDEDELLAMASVHQLSAIAAEGLKRAGRVDGRVAQTLYDAARIGATYDAERREILRRLEEDGIWYLPLKGTVLKDYYPRSYLRQMSDVDILVDWDRAEDVRRIMESLGYSVMDSTYTHHVSYLKPPGCHFELHRVLFEDELFETPCSVYYADVKRLMKKDPDNGYGYHFSDEDFYVYMVSHEYKHYHWCGTGLRSLLDRYVFLKRFSDRLDWAYIAAQTDRMELTPFEELNRRLALKVFSGGGTAGLTDEERSSLDYYTSSGAFGTSRHGIDNRVADEGKLRFILSRIFLPMPYIKRYYPFFHRHKVLIPLLPFYRIIRGWKHARRELAMVRKAGKEGKA